MLIYELAVRGVAVDDSKTVDQLRSSLRAIMKLEKLGQGLNLSSSGYVADINTEFPYIESVLKEISDGIKSMSPENAGSRFELNQSRLVHLLGRTNRIPTENLTQSQLSKRGDFLAEILGLLDRLENISVNDPNISILLNNSVAVNNLATHTSTPTHSTPPVHVASHVVPPAVNTTISQKVEPVQKWGVKFSGDLRVMSVHAFLERVNELRIARNVSEDDLFHSAIDLFSGKALSWFRAYHSRFSTWTELSDLLKTHYEPPDYRSRLFREILDRTQDSTEGIVDYLTTMSSLFRRYGMVPPEAQLEIVIRNLAPFYTTQLPVVDTLEELEKECLKLEAKKYRAEHYAPPPRRRNNLVEPDFAFVETSCEEPATSVFAVQNSNTSSNVQNSRGSSQITCWNCRKTGHTNKECKQPRKLHCFKCGNVGTTVRNCPNCSGNGSRGNRT